MDNRIVILLISLVLGYMPLNAVNSWVFRNDGKAASVYGLSNQMFDSASDMTLTITRSTSSSAAPQMTTLAQGQSYTFTPQNDQDQISFSWKAANTASLTLTYIGNTAPSTSCIRGGVCGTWPYDIPGDKYLAAVSGAYLSVVAPGTISLFVMVAPNNLLSSRTSDIYLAYKPVSS